MGLRWLKDGRRVNAPPPSPFSSAATPVAGARPGSERRDAILTTAQALFSRYGYRGVALRQIAAEAGVSLTLLNHYFGAKHQLFGAVVGAWRTLLTPSLAELDELAEGRRPAARPADVVDALLAGLGRIAARPEGTQLLWMHLRSRHDDDPMVSSALTELFAPVEAAFTAALLALRPGSDRARLGVLYQCARGALLESFASREAESARLGPTGDPTGRRAADEAVRSFLVAGVEVALGADGRGV